MRAVRIQKFGGPEVLEMREAEPVPTPGPGQVSIDVVYTGVNFADIKVRAEGYRVPHLPFVPGLEVSGRIRQLGAGVTGLSIGQEVAALTAGGAYAEVAVTGAETVFPLPEGVDLRIGATLPTVLPTAYALVHSVGRLQPGETVLVQGAAGGVGTVVGQLAKAAGAGKIVGLTSGEAKAAYAREHGYDEVIVTSGAAFTDAVRAVTGGRGVDLALDPVGGAAFRSALASLAPFGRLVSFGNAASEEPWQVAQTDLYPAAASVTGFSILTLAKTAPDVLRELAGHAFAKVTDGTVTLPVTAEFSLDAAAEAHRLMESRTSTGKLLLKVG